MIYCILKLRTWKNKSIFKNDPKECRFHWVKLNVHFSTHVDFSEFSNLGNDRNNNNTGIILLKIVRCMQFAIINQYIISARVLLMFVFHMITMIFIFLLVLSRLIKLLVT